MERALTLLLCAAALPRSPRVNLGPEVEPEAPAKADIFAYANELNTRKACHQPPREDAYAYPNLFARERYEYPLPHNTVLFPDQWDGPVVLRSSSLRPSMVAVATGVAVFNEPLGGTEHFDRDGLSHIDYEHGYHKHDDYKAKGLALGGGISATSSGAVGPTRPALYLPIWKAASTTVTDMMQAFGYQTIIGPHDFMPNRTGCVAIANRSDAFANTREVCYAHGPVSTMITDEVISGGGCFTVVRDPLLRLVSGMEPHRQTPLPQCNGDVCEQYMQQLTQHVRRLYDKEQLFAFGDEISGRMQLVNGTALPPDLQYAHWLSQTRFLQTTDGHGSRLKLDAALHMEALSTELPQLLDHLGVTAFADHNYLDATLRRLEELSGAHIQGRLQDCPDNRMNCKDESIEAKYATALLRQSTTACMLCAILWQDWECLGYAKPMQCEMFGTDTEHCEEAGSGAL